LPDDFVVDAPDAAPDMRRNRPVYSVTDVVAETPWYCLYSGKKVFRNFDFKEGRLTEVDGEECLDVLIRTLSYQRPDDREYVRARREHAWFEAKKILGFRSTNCIPEPLDFLEVRNEQDVFSFPRAGQLAATEPVLIFERVYGCNLAVWRKEKLPDLASIIHVCSQILELIEAFHSRGLILNVVGPSSFWVDDLQQIYFIGTDAVVEEAKAERWRQLFPAERYPQGFTPQELFDPACVPTRESDLFGWAGLFYFLVTGESPAAIAGEQQRRWTTFGPRQWDRFRRDLSATSNGLALEACKWLGVSGSKFAQNWPRSLIGGLTACLEVDRSARPGDAETLRNWWAAAPPQPVPASIGLRYSEGRARISFGPTEPETAAEFVVVRQLGEPPRSIGNGAIVWRARAGGPIEDRPGQPPGSRSRSAGASWAYSVFAVESTDGAEVVSRPTPTVILDASVPGFRRELAEKMAMEATPGQDIRPPTELELLCSLDAHSEVAAELLTSRTGRVRAWAIALLGLRLRDAVGDEACRKLLFDHAARDDTYELRVEAAKILIQSGPHNNVALTVKLAAALGGDGIDDQIRAAKALGALGVPAQTVERAVRSLERNREVECPACGTKRRAGDLGEHLVSRHGYVSVEGKVLPFDKAQTLLWERTILDQSSGSLRDAVASLAKRYGEDNSTHLCSAFRSNFIRLSSRLFDRGGVMSARFVGALAECLGSEKTFRRACRPLLADDNAAVRSIARAMFLPNIAKNAAAESVEPAQIRTAVEFLAPTGSIDDRVAICKELAERGANPDAIARCEQDLQLERPTNCPDCGAIFQRGAIPRHRRIEHGAYEFDGKTWALEALIPRLVAQVLQRDTDLLAARMLVEIIEEKDGQGAATTLGAVFEGAIAHLRDPAVRESSLRIAASSIATLPVAPALATCLLRSAAPHSREFGMYVFGRIRVPPDDLCQAATEQMQCETIPLQAKRAATMRVLKAGAARPDICRRALRAFAQNMSEPADRIDALQAIKGEVGAAPEVDAVCSEIEDSRRIRCPKCDSVLSGRQMREHLASVHKLVFDGRRARRPWSVAMDCLESYAASPDPELLARGESIAAIEDGERSRLNFIREALRRRIEPGHFRQTLEDSIKGVDSTICPNCFGNVTGPEGAPVMSVRIDESGNLDSPLISIRRTRVAGLWTAIDISTRKREWDGPDPGWSPTRLGLVLLVLLFTWLPALLAVVVGQDRQAYLPVTGTALAAGGLGALLVLFLYHPRWDDPAEVTWNLVVPHFSRSGLDQVRASFIAGLARACSRARSRRRLRAAKALDEATAVIWTAVAKHELPYPYLAIPLNLRLMEHLRKSAGHRHAVDLVVGLLCDAMAAKLPLECVDCVTRAGEHVLALTALELIALKWQVYGIAHSLSISVANLLALADRCATIREILQARPKSTPATIWKAFATLDVSKSDVGVAKLVSALELANSWKLAPFHDHPDLLFACGHQSLFLCTKGLVYRNQCCATRPTISSRPKTEFVQTGWTYQRQDGGPDMRYKSNPPRGYQRTTGYELVIAGTAYAFSAEPRQLREDLQRLSEFFFGRIDSCADAYSVQSVPGAAERNSAPPLIKCNTCGCLMRFRRGKLAIPQ
jgi:hypothetical protein